LQSEQQVVDNISSMSSGTLTPLTMPINYSNAHRAYIATAAGHCEWFKSISRGEALTEKIVVPHWQSFTDDFQKVISQIWGTALG
jgi:hypothetical protein